MDFVFQTMDKFSIIIRVSGIQVPPPLPFKLVFPKEKNLIQWIEFREGSLNGPRAGEWPIFTRRSRLEEWSFISLAAPPPRRRDETVMQSSLRAF